MRPLILLTCEEYHNFLIEKQLPFIADNIHYCKPCWEERITGCCGSCIQFMGWGSFLLPKYDKKLGYWTPTGCTLPYFLRPIPCVFYACARWPNREFSWYSSNHGGVIIYDNKELKAPGWEERYNYYIGQTEEWRKLYG
jgi:hypothetical protein